jgi:lipopolysaccharide transport system ATP-binding protein
MEDAVIFKRVGKRFRRYHVDAPGTIHEALLRGFRKLAPADVFWGLREVDFRAEKGRTIGVVGRNGAGKSTLLRLIAGVGRADEGTIEVRGRVSALLNLGTGFHPELTGRENLLINGVIGGLTKRELARRFDAIVDFSELEEFIDTPLRAYSSGMQMRLAFSIAIHCDPEILLIDEVLAVGDVAFQRKCMDHIMRLKAAGCTIILVSHDTGVIADLCEQALWLQAGRVACIGPSGEVVDRYLAAADAQSWSHMPVANFSGAL